MTGWSSHPWLRSVPHPALILHGDRDPVVPLANGRYLAHALPHGRLEVVSGGGHLFLYDEPRTVAPALLSFLAD